MLIVDGGLSSVGKGRLFMVELALATSLLVRSSFTVNLRVYIPLVSCRKQEIYNLTSIL